MQSKSVTLFLSIVMGLFLTGNASAQSASIHDPGTEINAAPYFSDWGPHGANHYSLPMFGNDTAYFTNMIDAGILHPAIESRNDTIRDQALLTEPASLLLFGAGLIGLAGVGRKKFKKK